MFAVAKWTVEMHGLAYDACHPVGSTRVLQEFAVPRLALRLRKRDYANSTLPRISSHDPLTEGLQEYHDVLRRSRPANASLCPASKVPKKPWGEQNVLAPRTWAWLPKSSLFKGARKRVLGMNRWACASLPGFATDPRSEFWVSEMACMPREHRLPTSASESTTCISPPSVMSEFRSLGTDIPVQACIGRRLGHSSVRCNPQCEWMERFIRAFCSWGHECSGSNFHQLSGVSEQVLRACI